MTGQKKKPDCEADSSVKPPYHILLVDDQAIIYEAVRRMLSSAGDIELHYCQDGAKALQMAAELNPDVILQDLVMPDVDGLMLVKFYRASSQTCDVPVVVLSSKDEAATKAEAFTCGANDYLVKLPDQIEMLARLRYHAKAHAALMERNAALEELKRISSTDGLTGLHNRRHFDETLDHELKRARREKQPLSLLLLDVDHFKQFNDHYGHPAGDVCLQQVASALKATVVRPGDLAARYGGEEFVAILPSTDAAGALKVAEAVRCAISDLGIEHGFSSAGNVVTVSVGAATVIPDEKSHAETLIGAADQALYQAKESGRNRVMMRESESPRSARPA